MASQKFTLLSSVAWSILILTSGSAWAQLPPSIPVGGQAPASVRAHQLKGEARQVRDNSHTTNSTSAPKKTGSPAPSRPSSEGQGRGDNSSSLHRTAASGSPEVLAEMITAEPARLHERDPSGYTPLHHAASTGNVEALEYLISVGAKLDSLGTRRESSLALAAGRGHSNAVQALLKAGANPNIASDTGSTALHRAAQEGHTETVKVLLEGGASPDLVDSRGRSALQVAEHYRQGDSLGVIRLLKAKEKK